MIATKPLPSYLSKRYLGWRATGYEENKFWYQRLASEGQRPRAMVIACCDSRVHINKLFEADSGELFIHRNIANLVPPHRPDGDLHGTSAAIEYAVVHLKVAHLIVMGHSNCGGVQGCIDLCRGNAPDLDKPESFIGPWLEILKPGYERVANSAEEDSLNETVEKEAVLVSLENLTTFPWVRDALEAGDLSLHGLWNDIGDGRLHEYLSEKDKFFPV